MKRNIKKKLFGEIFFTLYIVFILTGQLFSSGKKVISFTREEKNWLQKHPVIRVGIINDWPPMDFVDQEGIPRGIGVDYIKLINKKIKNRLKIIPGSWQEIYAKCKNKKLDALMDITDKPERRKFFNFTREYINIPHGIIALKSGPYYQRIEDLKGKILAAERKYGIVNFIKRNYPSIKIKKYNSTSDALDAVAKKEAHAYIGNRAVASHIIARELLGNLLLHGKVKEISSNNSIGVRKDWPILVTILDKILASVSKKESLAINRKWNNIKLRKYYKLKLTTQEKNWLKKHPVIRIASDHSWPPIEFLGENNRFQGIAIDYMKKIEKMLKIRFDFLKGYSWNQLIQMGINKKVDVFSCVLKTPKRSKFLNFTKPYIKIPIGIYGDNSITYISDLKELYGKKAAVVKGHAIHEILLDSHPKIQLITVKDSFQGIVAIKKKKALFFLDSVLTTNRMIEKKNLTGIKQVGETPYFYSQRIGIRKNWIILKDIMEKALNSIPAYEKSFIYHKWVSKPINQALDYSIFWKIGAAGLILYLLLFYWLRKMAREINLRKKVESKLKETQKIARVGQWEYNLVKDELTWSDEVFNIFEICEKDFSPSYKLFFELIHPGDVELVEKAYENSLKDKKASSQVIHRLIMRDGRIKYLSQNWQTKFDLSGKPLISIGSIQDITEIKKAEMEIRSKQELLQSIVDNMVGTVLYLKDINGKYILINRFYEQATGKKVKDLIGKTDYDVFSAEVAEKLRENDKYIVEERKTHSSLEQFPHPDGTEHVYQTIKSPIYNSENKIIGLLGLSTDITPLKKMEAELIEAKETAEKANRAKSEFLSNMTHELRTPLNVILGFAGQALKQKDLSDANKNRIKKIYNSGEHLLMLINDILDISKIEAGKISYNEQAFDLYNLIEFLENTFRFSSEQKNIQMKIEIAKKLPRMIKTDEGKLKQILINLLSNALKFTDYGEIKLSIRHEVLTHNTLKIFFDVSDTGMGIEIDDQKNIFNAFEQSKTGKVTQFKGTGLGLAISKKYIELLDGEIKVSSEVGKGSYFSFYIVCTQAEKEKISSSNNLEDKMVLGLKKENKKFTILVADDLETNRELIIDLLEEVGFNVIDAANGLEAFDKWKKESPDLIFMDRKMPELDGKGAIQKIRADRAGEEIPIIALTAAAYQEEREEMLNAGANDFISKPFNENEVFEKIQKYLNVEYIYEED